MRWLGRWGLALRSTKDGRQQNDNHTTTGSAAIDRWRVDYIGWVLLHRICKWEEWEMTMKIKLTQEQADAIELAIRDCGVDRVIELHAGMPGGGWMTEGYEPLNDLSQANLARALLIGYEVEPKFKIRDWVTNTSTGVTSVLEQKEELRLNDYPDRYSHIRHATPEEIAQEKEKRFWKSVGREVGEFKEGDVGVLRNGQKFSHLNNLKNYHDDLVGFYPIESFVSFGGDEE